MLNYLWAGMMIIGILWGAFHGQLPAVTEGALQSSKEAVTLCITMLGVMSLWTGVLEIGHRSGLVDQLAGRMSPLLTFLFPRLSPQGEARKQIAVNMIANILGLGWAATPAGIKAMEELKKAGKIRAIGLSNFSLEEMKAAMKFGQVDVIQPCYSLLWRYDEALLEFSRKQEISVIPYSTLAQGLLTGKYQKGAVFTDGRARAALFQPENYDRCLEVTDVLSQISAKYGKTPAQGAIAWLLQTQGITAPIVGAKNGRQAQENLKAAGWQFSKEDYDVIDRASRRFMEGLPHYTLFFNTETTN